MHQLRLVLPLLILLIIFIRCTNTGNTAKEKSSNPELQTKLSALLMDKEYFKLKEAVESREADQSAEQKLYYTAIIKNVFNQPAESTRVIDSILRFHSAALTDSQRLF